MTGDAFRHAALDLHDAVEGAHMGHPDFRANGRIFAGLDANEQIGTLNLTPDEQRELIQMHPDTFAPAAGAWGRQGWTVVRLKTADAPSVRGALLLAWQGVTSKPRKSASATRRRTAAKRPARKRR